MAALLDTADAEDTVAGCDTAHPARKLASKLCNCGRSPILWQAQGDGRLIRSLARCRSRVCPTCSTLRTREVQARVRELVAHVDDARMLTLTLASCDDSLTDQIDRLRNSFKELRRSVGWKRHVTGGLSTLEITWNHSRQQWHPHLHVVLDGTYWPQAEIADAWHTVTGDSRIVDIRRIASREALSRYVAKYVAKSQDPSQLPGPRLAEWALAMHGRRTYQPFGHLHGRKLDASQPDDNGELDHVCPLDAIYESSLDGDRRARRLWSALNATLRRGVSVVAGRPDADPLTRHRSLARRIRRWWQSVQDAHHDPTTVRNRPPPRGDRPGDRSQRLWEIDADTTAQLAQ